MVGEAGEGMTRGMEEEEEVGERGWRMKDGGWRMEGSFGIDIVERGGCLAGRPREERRAR